VTRVLSVVLALMVAGCTGGLSATETQRDWEDESGEAWESYLG
jgi:hypothetical protein